MKVIIVISLFLATLSGHRAVSQTSPITFGAVSRADLEALPYPQEQGAEAVVLSDFEAARLIYKDGFKVEITRHVRIKLLKSSGYDYANIIIEYSLGDKLLNLKASTHNLVNDKLEEIPVGHKQFYEEKTTYWDKTMRFAFPQVREGSIIEYAYTLEQQEIRRFTPFTFQQSIPVRYVERWATIPGYFNYSLNFAGNSKIKQSHKREDAFFHTYSTPFDYYEWTGSHLPPLQPEPNMPESNEFLPGVRFSLASVNLPGTWRFEVAPTYKKLTEDLLIGTEFANQLGNSRLFKDEVSRVISGRITPIEKMQAIYDHVKDHIRWDGMERGIPFESVRIAYRDRTGNNADINTILINMLRTAGISADPVMLSTRENGTLNPFVALTGDLNYMICRAEIDGKQYLLDATDQYRPLGMLPFRCLNREGWLLHATRGRWIPLLQEEKRSLAEAYDLTIDDNGRISGRATITLDGYTALEYRRFIQNQSESGIREEKIATAGNLKITDMRAKNLAEINEPLILTFSLEMDHRLQSGHDFYFFQPLANLFGSLDNSWIKDERTFPIDFGCPVYSEISCIYHLPESIQLGDLPQNLKLGLPNDEALFIYRISHAGDDLTVSGELSLVKTWFDPEQYPALREFYTQVIKKTNEMVILH